MSAFPENNTQRAPVTRDAWPRVRQCAAAAVLAFVSFTGCADRAPVDVPSDRILLIVVDTLRSDYVSAYGSSAVSTPNIDAIAAKGQRFDHVMASYHQTSMSMASLFSGRTPSLESGRLATPVSLVSRTWCGLSRLSDDRNAKTCIPTSIQTLAGALRQGGYWTAGIASNALLYRPLGYDRGFDRWEEVSDELRARVSKPYRGDYRSRAASEVHRVAADILDNRESDRFFLYVHYMDVHDYRLARRSYARSVEIVDAAIGRLISMFEERGILDGTTIVLFSDHGERLNERHFIDGRPSHAGNPSFDEVLRVPLIIAPPTHVKSADVRRTDDVHRLIRRLAGVEVGPDPDLEPHELFLSENEYQVYRDARWKSYRGRADACIQLVDTRADPGEKTDVASEHPDVVERHRRRMEELTQTLAAPLGVESVLTPDDRKRLESLGYL